MKIPIKMSRVQPALRLILIGGLLFVPVGQVLAQVEPDPVLPNLAPREVEIRGQLVIQFPALERQPLIGFNPPPRIPVVPSDRRPIIEDYKQNRADLPQSSVARPSPPGALLPGAEFLRGELEAAGGSYFDRLVRARFATDVAENLTGIVRLDYFGTDGSLVGIADNQERRNPFDTFDGSAGLNYRTHDVHVRGSVSGFTDSYTVFGLRSPLDSLASDSPARKVSGASLDLAFATNTSRRFHSETDILLETGAARSDNAPDSLSLPRDVKSEKRFDLSSENTIRFGDVGVVASLSGGLEGIANEDGIASTKVNESIAYYNSGISVQRNFARANARLGVNVIGSSIDTDTSTTAGKHRLVYLSPIVDLNAHLTNGLTVFLRNRPEVHANSVAESFTRSPYLTSLPMLEPTLFIIQADAGVNLGFDPIQLSLSAGYDQSPNFQFFAPASIGSLSGYLTPAYDKGTVFRATVTADVDITGALHGSVSATYRDGRLPDLDADIPYFADFVGHASLGYRFLDHRALFQLDGRYVGERFRDVDNVDTIDPTLALDVTALFNVTPSIGLTLRGRNLLGDNLEFWDGFPQVGRQFLVGFRLLW